MPTSRTVRTPKPEPVPSSVQAGFDPTVLDALLDLGARQHQLEEFRQRAEDKRTAVTAAVYDRVVKDYQTRLAALKAEAAPLKRRVRAEYQKLQSVIDGLQRRLQAASLDKEELEFRRDVGEIDASEFDNRVSGPAGIIDETKAELSGLEAQAARFVEALGPDDPADATPPEAIPAVAPPVTLEVEEPAATMLAEYPGDSGPTMMADATMLVADAMAPPETDSGSLGATEYLSPEAVSQATAEALSAEAGNTISLPEAMLVLEEDGTTTEFVLSLLSYIGRSEGNQVQLARAGVSRRHAMITAAGEGRYKIQDLQSQNGTFVNGERITEATLSDGDRIAVGDVEVTFRSNLAV